MADYIIKKGDTLSKIAKENGTTVSDLVKANNIADANKIYEGQTLKLPGAKDATSSAAGNATSSNTTGNTTNNTASNKPASALDMAFSYDPYTESDTVKQYAQAVQDHNAEKPGAYESQYDAQIDSIMNQILNREKFSYDLNGDALYQQYKDQYQALGRMASMNTMGQAAALTGGYGNSYATTAANQAYQSYLTQLNDVIPELYGMALDKYNNETNELYNQYGVLSDKENEAYGRYQDSLDAWNAERDYLTGRYEAERDADRAQYDAALNLAYDQFQNDRSYQYQYELDEKEREAASVVEDAESLTEDEQKAEFGGLTAKDFTSAMRDAALDGNENDAKALVVAAGNSPAAMEIYDIYFGKGADEGNDTTVVANTVKYPRLWARNYSIGEIGL